MIKTLMALSLFVAACGAEEEEFSLDDLSVRLPDEPPGGKSDEAVTCGDSSCSWDRCGYSCPAGEQCHRACQPRDTRADAFTKLTIGATTLDSRALAYQPVVRLTDVLFHGCELWDFSNGQYDGLEISYRELRQGAFRASDRTTHDHYFMLYTKPFTGPGSYRAEASYAASSEARTAGETYRGTDVCSVDVRDEAGMLAGSFSCSLPGASGSLAVTGEFRCGGTAFDPLIISRH